MAEKLRSDRSGSISYYSVMGQDFIRKSTEDNKDAVKRLNTNNVEVWEIHAEELSGIITSVKLVDNPSLKRKELHIMLEDADEKMLIQLPASYRMAISFMLLLPNMKRGEFYILKPFHFNTKDTGKLQSGINAYDKRGVSKESKTPRLDSRDLAWFPKVDEDKKAMMGQEYWPGYFSEVAFFVYKNLLPGIMAEFNKEETKTEPEEQKPANQITRTANTVSADMVEADKGYEGDDLPF